MRLDFGLSSQFGLASAFSLGLASAFGGGNLLLYQLVNAGVERGSLFALLRYRGLQFGLFLVQFVHHLLAFLLLALQFALFGLSFAQQAVLLGFHAKQFVAFGLHLRLLLPYDFGLGTLVAAETAQVAQTAVHLLKVLGRQNKLPLRHLHAVVKYV